MGTKTGNRRSVAGRSQKAAARYFLLLFFNPLAVSALDYFIERVFDNTHGAVLNQLGNQVPHFALIDHAFDGKPFYALEVGGRIERRDGRGGDARDEADDFFKIRFRDV